MAKKKAVNAYATYIEIKDHVASMEDDFTKFNNGTKAAASRLRKTAMEIKKLTGTLRKEIQEQKNSM